MGDLSSYNQVGFLFAAREIPSWRWSLLALSGRSEVRGKRSRNLPAAVLPQLSVRMEGLDGHVGLGRAEAHKTFPLREQSLC